MMEGEYEGFLRFGERRGFRWEKEKFFGFYSFLENCWELEIIAYLEIFGRK